MTLRGTINNCFFLLVLVCLGAFWAWKYSFVHGQTAPQFAWNIWYIPAIISTLAIAIAIVFKKTWAPTLAPLYAVLEGLILGVVSVFFEQQFPGIVLQAVLCTVGTFFALLFVYRLGLIVATEKFKIGIVAATGGIALTYLLSFGLQFFGVQIPFINEGGPMGILFSVFVTAIAALNLILDFDFIEQGVQKGAPKYMEWYAAFAMLVTLVWLYLEILRLLAKMRRK